jgi:multicomponent K+:H+ antiporter subunit C
MMPSLALLVAVFVGVFAACGVYLILRRRVFDVVLGLTLISYAVNLFIFFMGRLAVGKPPIVEAGRALNLSNYADPLPQALVLTAIVISFGMTAVLLAIAVRGYIENGHDDVDDSSEQLK